MKEQFIEKRFAEKSRQLIETADAICCEYEDQGYDLSLRQLYYQFVARNLLENTERNYKKLGSIISDARLAGLIDWKHIKDRGRTLQSVEHWESPKELLEEAAETFTIDTWKWQKNIIFCMVEKQALEGVLWPVCSRLNIFFMANKGYSSSSAMYKVGKFIDYKVRSFEGRFHPVVLYLGDHDPSGIDMTRDVDERLNLFSSRTVEVIRLALNMDQIEKYNPPENPAKLTDPRASNYVSEFGDSSWELDALEPSVLAKLVEDATIDLRDDDIYQEQVEKQEAWREDLKNFSETFSEEN